MLKIIMTFFVIHGSFPSTKQWILFRFREACTQLHRIGALNDNVVPSLDFELDDEKKFINPGKTSNFGTTQQKELYPVQAAEYLTGYWLTGESDARLYANSMSFDVSAVEDEVHSSLVLLTGSLNLPKKLGKFGQIQSFSFLAFWADSVKLSPLGTTTLTADQVCVISFVQLLH